MRHLDLFSGLGSWALAAQYVWGSDYECIGFCEIDWFCRMVLQKNFPGVPIYGDIKTLTNADSTGLEGSCRQKAPITINSGRITLLTASPPCQAASQAGRRRGTTDDRWLWPQTFDVIRIIKPTWCILENVYGLLTLERGLVFEELCTTLEGIGYEVQSFIIPAVAVNAPHRRDRIWIIAHSLDQRAGDTCEMGREQRRPAMPLGADSVRPPDGMPSLHWPDAAAWERDWSEVALATCLSPLDDGAAGELAQFPDGLTISQARLRREGLKALGNAICPQVAVEIMRAIKAASL